MWLKIRGDEEVFGNQMVMKRDDEECFSNTVCKPRDEGRIFSNHMIGKEVLTNFL
jgi:hypothetical protein